MASSGPTTELAALEKNCGYLGSSTAAAAVPVPLPLPTLVAVDVARSDFLYMIAVVLTNTHDVPLQ